jgi:hypothetical protein
MIIQTVYRPEENLDYLDDWLNHHTKIGVTHFYMYDNGGSRWIENNFGISKKMKMPENYVKYGIKIKYNVEEARERQKDIFKKYPVTVIKWQRKNKDGELLYAQIESVLDFAKNIKSGLCAFIDIDEFIIKNEEFKVGRMYQRKFKHRSFYKTVYDCYDHIPINTKTWTPKVILNMSQFPSTSSTDHNIHFDHINIPISKNVFNHYNYNRITHKWVLEHIESLDPFWKYKNEKKWENCIEKINDHGLVT